MKEAENTQTSETHTLNIPVVIGSFVRFYDCQIANTEKDYSGANPNR